MDRTDLASRIDHTVLGPTTTLADVERVLEEAMEYGTNACIPPCYLPMAAEYAPRTTLVTVVGFPHGQQTTGVKTAEAKRAWTDGADELDVVCNVGRLRASEDETIRDELEEIVAAVPIPVKIIVESAFLTDEELGRVCELAAGTDAAFVKTATGFAEDGATVEAVERMAEDLPVKASGGIGSWAEAKAMFDAGAERIGASSGVAIVEGFESAEKP